MFSILRSTWAVHEQAFDFGYGNRNTGAEATIPAGYCSRKRHAKRHAEILRISKVFVASIL